MATPKPCTLQGRYVGVAQYWGAMWLVDASADCDARVPPREREPVQLFSGWLPDGSGLLYLEGKRGGPGADACIWNILQQRRTDCYMERPNDLVGAAWSAGSTNYIAFEHWNAESGRTYLTIMQAQSRTIVYRTSEQTLAAGTDERLLSWAPDGRQLLLAVDRPTQQAAVVLTVDTGRRDTLATLEAQEDYLIKGIWVQDGQAVALGVTDHELCCNGEFIPDASDLYVVDASGGNLRRLLTDGRVATFLAVPGASRLVIDTYGREGGRIYWLDSDRGMLTPVFAEEFESRGPGLVALTPDGRYIITLDDRWQTWLSDPVTGEQIKLETLMFSRIYWRP